MNRNTFIPLLTAVLAVAALYFLFPQWAHMDFTSKPNLNLGLDLQGGMYLKMEVDMDKLPKDADGQPNPRLRDCGPGDR